MRLQQLVVVGALAAGLAGGAPHVEAAPKKVVATTQARAANTLGNQKKCDQPVTLGNKPIAWTEAGTSPSCATREAMMNFFTALKMDDQGKISLGGGGKNLFTGDYIIQALDALYIHLDPRNIGKPGFGPKIKIPNMYIGNTTSDGKPARWFDVQGMSVPHSVKILGTMFAKKGGGTEFASLQSGILPGNTSYAYYLPADKVPDTTREEEINGKRYKIKTYYVIMYATGCTNGTLGEVEIREEIPNTPDKPNDNGGGGGDGGGGDGNGGDGGGGNITIWHGSGYTPKYEYGESSGWVPTNPEWRIPTPPIATSTMPLTPPPIVPGVPEPKTYATMLAGLGFLRFFTLLRNKKQTKR